jgi:hypothetical protein
LSLKAGAKVQLYFYLASFILKKINYFLSFKTNSMYQRTCNADPYLTDGKGKSFFYFWQTFFLKKFEDFLNPLLPFNML